MKIVAPAAALLEKAELNVEEKKNRGGWRPGGGFGTWSCFHG